MPLPNDKYGRSVSMSTIGSDDVYEVGSGPDFTVSFPTGTSQVTAYDSIDRLAPSTYVESPVDQTLESEFDVPANSTYDFEDVKYSKDDYVGATFTYVFIQETTLSTEVGTTYLTNNPTDVTQASSGGYLVGNIGISLEPIIVGDYVVIRATNSNNTYSCKVRIKIECLRG